jgi:hypothetical protein
MPRPVTTVDKSKHHSHRWTHFLPDGRHFVYLAITPQESTRSKQWRLLCIVRWQGEPGKNLGVAESGRFEVYVIPSVGTGGKWQLSSGGGQQPVWRRDGKELFYLSLDDSLMSVPIALKSDSVQADAARPLFPLANSILSVNGLVGPYDVTPDGKRFLVITAEQGKSFPINLVTNWTAELEK